MSSQSSGVTRPGHALPGGTLALRGAGVHWALWGSRQWLQGVGDIWGRLWYEGMIMMFKRSYGGFQKWGYPKMNGLLLFFNIIYVYNIDVWTHIPWFTDEHPSTHSEISKTCAHNKPTSGIMGCFGGWGGVRGGCNNVLSSACQRRCNIATLQHLLQVTSKTLFIRCNIFK